MDSETIFFGTKHLCQLAGINAILATAYLGLRLHDGKRDSTFLPTWQTWCSFALSTLVLVYCLGTYCIKSKLKESSTARINRVKTAIFLSVFNIAFTINTAAVDCTLIYYFPVQFEFACVEPSVRCTVGFYLCSSAASLLFFVPMEAAAMIFVSALVQLHEEGINESTHTTAFKEERQVDSNGGITTNTRVTTVKYEYFTLEPPIPT